MFQAFYGPLATMLNRGPVPLSYSASIEENAITPNLPGYVGNNHPYWPKHIPSYAYPPPRYDLAVPM